MKLEEIACLKFTRPPGWQTGSVWARSRVWNIMDWPFYEMLHYIEIVNVWAV